MLRVPVYPCFKSFVCNTNNLHQFDPYTITDDGNIIDVIWWESLPELAKLLINKRCNFKLDNIDMPHDISKDKDNFLHNVYYSLLECFDYNNWYSYDIPNGPKEVNMINIDHNIKTVLIVLYQQYNISDSDNTVLDNFKRQIEANIVSGDKYFIRLSGTSGKNEKSIESYDNVDDIIKHLTSTKLFVDQEYKLDKDSYLIMIKWNDRLNQRYEFRIFVVDNKITAVSQQYWQTLYQYSKKELDIIEYALTNMAFIGKIPYHTFIGDVYIDIDTKTCHLIECNPFGAYSGAGSGLFEWEKDYDLLYGINNKPEFRYLSIINY